MPEPRRLLSREVDFPFGGIDDAPVMPETEPAVELPDQPAGHVRQQGMVEITGPQRFDGDGPLSQQEPLDAAAVCREHLLHVFHRALQILPLFGVMLLYVGWNAIQRFPRRIV